MEIIPQADIGVRIPTFVRMLTSEILTRIAASPWTSVDFETTALTPSSPPTRLSSSQKIGSEHTAAAYQRLHGAGVDCRPRARIWSIQLASGEALAVDLDHLQPADIATLLQTSINGKVLFGHNLGFDLGWALHYTDNLHPARVIDTMLLVRCMRPGLPWKVHKLAAEGQEAAKAFVDRRKGDASASLNALCIAAGLSILNKDFQKPHNWCVRHLSRGHYDYCLSDIAAPIDIVRYIAGVKDPMAAVEALWTQDLDHNGGCYFSLYQHAPLALARMSRRGLPLHLPTLQAIHADRLARVYRVLPTLYQYMPAMRDHIDKLQAAKLSTSKEMKLILGAYAQAHGCTLDESDDGTPIIQRKSAALAGATKLPGWQAWDELQRSKKILGLCSEYQDYSREQDATWRRLHPLIGAVTVTLRCSSQAPNSQNLLRPEANPIAPGPLVSVEHHADENQLVVLDSRGSAHALTASSYLDRVCPNDLAATAEAIAERHDLLQFRAVVRAPDGHKIISVDQAQVELRIAAALAQRAITEIEAALSGTFTAPRWVLAAIRRGEDYSAELHPGAEGFAGLQNEIAATWRRVRQTGAPLAEVFRRGLDPHLLTGVGMAARAGKLDLRGLTPVEYLSHPDTDTKALNNTLKTERQNAKPANFGLLYGAQASTLWRLGVTDYGLDWTAEEAAAVHDAWMVQYCDVRMWQLWTQFVHCSSKHDTIDLYREHRYTKALETKAYKIRTGRTLGGRPLYTPELREILNHMDQSTGAEVTTHAIVHMPEPACGRLVNAVHDELLAIAPDAEVETVGQQIRAAMIAAMDRLLSPWGIPSGADVTVGQYWSKD